MKKSLLLIVLCLTGCISERAFQPPPEGYEMFRGHQTNDEL